MLWAYTCVFAPSFLPHREQAMTTTAVSPAVEYATDPKNKKRSLEELKNLLRIPSISTLPEHKPDIERAAKFVADEMKRLGLENVEIIKGEGHPLVYADWL